MHFAKHPEYIRLVAIGYAADREQATGDGIGRHICFKRCVYHGAETVPYETQRIAQMADPAVINRQPRTVD